MVSLSLNQLFLLYLWFPLAALIAFMLLIARFYQNFSGEQTFFRLYIIPLTLFSGAFARYASLNQVTGDVLGDLLSGLSGIFLIVLSLRLYQLMMSGRK